MRARRARRVRVRRNSDLEIRELERAVAAGDPGAAERLARLRKRSPTPKPVTPRRECYHLEQDPSHPDLVWPVLDGKRISNTPMPPQEAEWQIQYDMDERKRHPWWYQAIGQEHFGCPGCMPYYEKWPREGPWRHIQGNPRVKWNADLDLRELERLAAAGDGNAAVRLLRFRAQTGQLTEYPQVNTTLAYRLPRGRVLNEWAGGTNEWEFVDSALRGVAKLRETGAEPYMLVTEYGDDSFPAGFGSNLGTDVAWLRQTFLDIARLEAESFMRRRLQERYDEAFRLLSGSGFGHEAAEEALSYIVEFPETALDSGIPRSHDFTAKDFALVAGDWYVSVLTGYLDDIRRGGQ